MQIKHIDFNDAAGVIAEHFPVEWDELARVLTAMPLHLKASDQAGKQGSAIFDPVGTNAGIHVGLSPLQGWRSNIPIPTEYSFLGNDVDFGKRGLIVEAQFSNYPFLLNNLLRSELFFKAHLRLPNDPVQAVVVITKDGMFPASNSTLYYQQAENQLTALARNHVFDVPLRLVGLHERPGSRVPTKWTEYENPRYSRTVVTCRDGLCVVPMNGRRFVPE